MLSRRPRQRRSVATCRACGRDFVHPVTWGEEDENHWWMLLHCGWCGDRRDAVLSDADADDFDDKLERDQFLIARAADRLHQEWRTAEADAFTAALHDDLISADDFAQ